MDLLKGKEHQVGGTHPAKVLVLLSRINVLPDNAIFLALMIRRVTTPEHSSPPSFHLLQAVSDPCGGELCDVSLRVTLHRPAAAAPVQA